MTSLVDPELTPAEMKRAEALLDRVLAWKALPDYSRVERLVLAILAANLSRQQRIRAKKSRTAQKLNVENRRNYVNLLLRYVLEQKCRDNPNSLKTVMTIVAWLDTACGIEASEAQVRRDIHEVTKLGPLPKY
jgi:hypothetical protein